MRKFNDFVSIIFFWTVVVLISFSTLSQFKVTESNGDGLDSFAVNIRTTSSIKVYVSVDGMEHIKNFESLSLKVYKIEGEKLRTVGYGHQIKSTDPLWLRRKYVGDKITEKQAEEIFINDINEFVEPALKRLYRELEDNNIDTSKFSQGFTDSMASLIFNCGENGIRNSEFFRCLKKGHIKRAIAMVPNTHVYMKGHVKRRLAEANMMIES